LAAGDRSPLLDIADPLVERSARLQAANRIVQLSEDLGQVGSKSGLAITAHELIELFGWILVLGKWPYHRPRGSYPKTGVMSGLATIRPELKKCPLNQLAEDIVTGSSIETHSDMNFARDSFFAGASQKGKTGHLTGDPFRFYCEL
jgi:hypothetical protein